MRWPLLILAIVFVSGCISSDEKTCEQAIAEIPQIIADAQSSESAVVSRVIDGDTIEILGGTKIRFVGINTPEKSETNYLQAKTNMENMVSNKSVHLVKDITDEDKYGRKLRYVFTEDKFVNAEQVSAGLASSYEYPPDTKYQFLFNCLEKRAKYDKFGIWRGLGLYNFSVKINQNPDDVSEPNLESIIITNLGEKTNLNSWKLKDEATHIYTFSNIDLEKDESITIYSGKGTDTESTRYWNLATTVWNNDGDTVFLRDAQGNLALEYAY